ncbi:MAG: methyltransferase domain-containing protein [Candidatus Vogelbacteria bacterium]|nr:methyltransferase domain-containing protein [Candidatus Vogelbacteria bacterium]
MKIIKKLLTTAITGYKASRSRYHLVIFSLRGKKPWTKGYFEYKWQNIARVIADPNILNGFKNQERLLTGYGLGLDERIVEYPWLLAQMAPASGQWLDAGSILNFDIILKNQALKNKELSILTLNPETSCFWYRGISYLYGDIRELPFKDNHFDGIACVSTLEHIGMDNSLVYTDGKYKESKPADFLLAIRELQRVLKPGGVILLTVPFGQSENFGFFQQFDSAMIKEVEKIFDTGKCAKHFYAYGEAGWQLSTEAEAGTKTYFDIRTKRNDGPDHAAAARAVACLILKK